MKKRLISVTILALAMLVAVTPVLASGPGNQNQNQNQDREQSQHQEQNLGENQNQEKNLEKNQNQHGERNGHGEQPNPLPGNQLFALTGTITLLDTGSIRVMVYNGNRFVKPYIGQELVVLVTEDTVYRAYTPDGCVPIDFEHLEEGDSVYIKGTVSEGVFTALQVTADVPCCTP
jgi:hypothetical protein